MTKKPLYPHVPKTTYDRVEDVPGSKVTEELASRKKEAILLLKQAVAHAEVDEFESALWRAVDAAGLMSFFAHREATGMPPNPTGRGFFINKRK